MSTCLRTKWKGKTRKPRFHNKKFFDQECKEAKRLMRKYNSLLSKHPFNKEFKTQYFYYLKKYKRTLRKKNHDYENKLISQLESIANHDPKKYWQFVDTLKESVNPITYGILPFRQLRGGLFGPDPENKVTVNGLI